MAGAGDGNARKPPKKSDTLQIRIPHETKEEFLEACGQDATSASEVLRRSILDYLSLRKSAARAASPRSATKPKQGALIPFLRRRRVAIGATLAAAIGALAVMPSAADPDFRAAFNRMDANHDGKLTPDEYFETSGDLPWRITADAVFYRYDTEESIFLDYDKPDAGGTDRGIEINSAAAPATPQPLSLMLDTNGDGQVQFSEYEAQQLRDLKSRFAAIDRDNDGLLSPEELTLKPMDFSGVRSAVTVSADGRITMGLPAPPRPGERSPVATADVNGDGIVTLEEFVGSR